MPNELFQNQSYDTASSKEISTELSGIFKRRRTIRDFSKKKPERETILNCLEVANSAPSGANKRPWGFVLVEDQELKEHIRELAEYEERKFYHESPNKGWLEDLKDIGTNHLKSFLTDCPYLIAIFFRNYSENQAGGRDKNYYAKESTGIATGFLISALHLCGLNVLTYTPTRMQFLRGVLERKREEKVFMLLGVGHASEGCQVPILRRKTLEQVLQIYQ